MTSRVRIRSSRANGALSRGPKTPEGKLRSAGNRCTHGLYSPRVVLKTESQEEFDAFLQEYIDRFRPQNSFEFLAARQMAAARWCMRRMWATETRMLEDAMNALPTTTQEPMARIAQAFSNLAGNSAFNLIPRLESRYSRQYHTALEAIMKARKDARKPAGERMISPKIENEASIPLNEMFMDDPGPAQASPAAPAATLPPAPSVEACSSHKSAAPRRPDSPPPAIPASGWAACRRRPDPQAGAGIPRNRLPVPPHRHLRSPPRD